MNPWLPWLYGSLPTLNKGSKKEVAKFVRELFDHDTSSCIEEVVRATYVEEIANSILAMDCPNKMHEDKLYLVGNSGSFFFVKEAYLSANSH